MNEMSTAEFYGLSETAALPKVPIYRKMTLTIKEAAEYSNICINKIDAMLRQPNSVRPLCGNPQARQASGV